MFSTRLVNERFGAGEMVQVRVLTVKHDDLSLILRTTLWKEETSSDRLFSDLHMGAITCDHTPYHTNTKIKWKKKIKDFKNDRFG